MGAVQRRTRVALIAVAATALLAACTPESAQQADQPRNDRTIAIAPPSNMEMDAFGGGIAEWGDGGCMMLTPGDGDPLLILFPHGTTLDDNDEVVLPDGSRIRGGDDVSLGGGSRPAEASKRELAGVPEECITDEVWIAAGEHWDRLVHSDGDHFIAIAEPSDMQMDALASGIVEWGPGGCMVLSWRGESMLILFPHGTSLDNGEVVLPNDSRIQAGEEKAMGGGLHYLPGAEVKELEALPKECITEHVWVASGEHSDGIAR